ncbi:hypothetical protein OMK64_06600 [Cellulomonas fimi]|uniref:hypothetical protein n=1 Tax=Cellulomonas fimi TaxID=1708 RepID=UPI00234DE30B|nr:hypothetical protein [Cellulomonas fimi]MDC7121201.1 hypothetical protein [Cellulomonas fimi]
MRNVQTVVRLLSSCLVVVGTVLGVAAAPAGADADHPVDIRGLARCDSAAGEWVVTWEVTNRAGVAGTIGNVRAYPAGRALVGMPNRVQPGESVHGEQHLLASEYSGEIVFDVNWDDGAVTYQHHWPVHIRASCAG